MNLVNIDINIRYNDFEYFRSIKDIRVVLRKKTLLNILELVNQLDNFIQRIYGGMRSNSVLKTYCLSLIRSTLIYEF